jgi:hypothetical protein
VQFECGCGETVSIRDPETESELNVQVACERCESRYAVTITPFATNYESESEAFCE